MPKIRQYFSALVIAVSIPVAIYFINWFSNPVTGREAVVARVIEISPDGKSAVVKIKSGEKVRLIGIFRKVKTGDDVPVLVDILENNDRIYRLDQQALSFQ